MHSVWKITDVNTNDSKLISFHTKKHLHHRYKEHLLTLLQIQMRDPTTMPPGVTVVNRCPAQPKELHVTNLITEKKLPDTLHWQANRSMCPVTTCFGSLMQNDGTKRQPKRSTDEISSEAVKFIEEYYMHQKKSSADELTTRLSEISRELDETGTYTPTTKELEFGARTAWRNASRCVGRMQWQNLHFFDARHARTTKEMFDAVCKHIEFATNDGNIRSCITVFAARIPGRDDFRLWNPQLISYAGYLQPDGSVIGDPARVPLTRICEKLGWKGKGGRFDVLPLIFSTPNESATFYELPKEIVREVELEHPKFDWFAKMNLRWYALPAVSDMLFDVGGIEFPAAPFNGWYMGTEIGCRNLCDQQRYNLLPAFGEKMGLAIDDPISLWKDEVLLEVNKAVLHSFTKSGTTLVDHHTASQQFLQHMENETKKRGGCPTDWVWVVPPTSGSITGVYHQEMINYYLKPSFDYQVQAWKHYKKWKKIELKTKLKSVAYAILACVRLMHTIVANRVRVTILFATETGRSELFADRLSKLLSSSFTVRVIRMDDYELNELPLERLLFVVASTFGNGDAPENGKQFWKSLCNKQKQDSGYDLSKLMFAVFSLGSSLYPKFGFFGKNIDEKLHELNAKSLRPVTIGDEMKGQEKLFSVWCDAVYREAFEAFGLVEKTNGGDVTCNEQVISVDDAEDFGIDEIFNGSRYRIRMAVESDVESVTEKGLLNELSRIHHARRYPAIFPMNVIERQYLQPKGNIFDKQTLLVSLQPTHASHQLSYQPGDHLGVFPTNSPKVVHALWYHLRQCQPAFANLKDTILEVQFKKDQRKWVTQQRLPPCTLHEAFANYLDITSPPEQRFLASLALMATSETECGRLKQLARNPEEYKKWKSLNLPNLLDVLLEFPSVRITPEFLLSRRPLLAPRLYSISSSLRAYPDEVHLTMAVVQFSKNDAAKTRRSAKKLGVCTSFFERCPEKMVPCFVRPAPSFRLSDDNSVPIILIGAGTGIAPFRSFWQEREVIANELGVAALGKCILFFGCRSKSVDYLYAEEHSKLLRSGVVDSIFLALSREGKRIYVQDEIYSQRSLVYALLKHEGAHVYVCGDADMADGVQKSLAQVYVSEASCNESEAESAVDELISQSRYHEDVFGAMHSV